MGQTLPALSTEKMRCFPWGILPSFVYFSVLLWVALLFYFNLCFAQPLCLATFLFCAIFFFAVHGSPSTLVSPWWDAFFQRRAQSGEKAHLIDGRYLWTGIRFVGSRSLWKFALSIDTKKRSSRGASLSGGFARPAQRCTRSGSSPVTASNIASHC